MPEQPDLAVTANGDSDAVSAIAEWRKQVAAYCPPRQGHGNGQDATALNWFIFFRALDILQADNVIENLSDDEAVARFMCHSESREMVATTMNDLFAGLREILDVADIDFMEWLSSLGIWHIGGWASLESWIAEKEEEASPGGGYRRELAKIADRVLPFVRANLGDEIEPDSLRTSSAINKMRVMLPLLIGSSESPGVIVDKEMPLSKKIAAVRPIMEAVSDPKVMRKELEATYQNPRRPPLPAEIVLVQRKVLASTGEIVPLGEHPNEPGVILEHLELIVRAGDRELERLLAIVRRTDGMVRLEGEWSQTLQ
uniref:Uncharacterized protein n=1 Tax=viral metagenome TaxID=1070528 RepID=A0A6M3KTD3_9ZZZZ